MAPRRRQRPPGRRRARHARRRQGAQRRQLRDGVPGRRPARVPGGHGQGRAGGARADRPPRRHRARTTCSATSWATSTPGGARCRAPSRATPASRSSTPSCPQSELLRYAVDLRSLTGGRGPFTIAHDHYDVLPAHLVDRVRRDVHDGGLTPGRLAAWTTATSASTRTSRKTRRRSQTGSGRSARGSRRRSPGSSPTRTADRRRCAPDPIADALVGPRVRRATSATSSPCSASGSRSGPRRGHADASSPCAATTAASSSSTTSRSRRRGRRPRSRRTPRPAASAFEIAQPPSEWSRGGIYSYPEATPSDRCSWIGQHTVHEAAPPPPRHRADAARRTRGR